MNKQPGSVPTPPTRPRGPSDLADITDPRVHWQIIAGDIDVPLAIVDGDGNYLYANAACESLFGLPPGGVAGKNVRDLLPPEMAQERIELFKRTLASDRPLMFMQTIRGTRMRSTFRRVADPHDGPPRVLLLGNPAHSDSQGDKPLPGYEVVLPRNHDLGQLANLSERELEVLQLIGAGFSTAEIAAKIGRSVKTVESHRAALGHKLGVVNRVELARIAIRAGLSSLPLGSPRKLEPTPGTKLAAPKGEKSPS